MTWQDITPILSVVIAAAAFYFARKKDAQSDATQMAEAAVNINRMASDMADVKSDIKALREEYRADHDELVIMRGKVNALGERVDELKELVKK